MPPQSESEPSNIARVRFIVGLCGVMCLGWLTWSQIQRSQERARQELAQKPDPQIPDYDCVEQRPAESTHEPSDGPRLKDVTQELGIQFNHIVGPLGTYFMPESIGAGVAFLDYDRDGRQDLYFVNCGPSPKAKGSFAPGTDFRNRLFRQSESGAFVDVTNQSGLGDTGYGAGVAVGDVDNDGYPDVFIANYEQDALYRNKGNGEFENITNALGVQEKEWGAAAAFFDYDRDGKLDLLVVNYTADPEYGHSVACGFSHGLVSYCGPHKFKPTIDRLYHNESVTKPDGGSEVRFRDVTEDAGLAAASTFGFGAICTDLTGDGWPDIFIANDGAPNRFWVNQQNGTFLEEAQGRGVACNKAGHVEAGMGVAVGDVNHDTHLDFLVTHLTKETATLYVGSKEAYFIDKTPGSGIDVVSQRHTGWGVALIDLNHDGYLDVPLVNGLVIPCHSGFPFHGEDEFQVRSERIDNAAEYWKAYYDENVLMLGNSDGSYRTDRLAGGDFVRAMASGRGLASGDLDNDGDLDLVVTNCGGSARCYRNDLSSGRSWLTVTLQTGEKHRDALGARITIRLADNSERSGVCVPQTSYLCSNDSRVHFGLGDVNRVESLIVTWPDGPVSDSVEEFPGCEARKSVTLVRGQGKKIERTE